VLRPDLNFGDDLLDRPGALELIKKIRMGVRLPTSLQLLGDETRLVGLPLLQWLEQRQRAGAISSVVLFLHGSPVDWELGNWPVQSLLQHLHKTTGKPRLVLSADVLSDRELELSGKLDLHRLAIHAQLCFSQELPTANGKPVLVVLEEQKRTIGVVALDTADAHPGPSWGSGMSAPLIKGPVSATTSLQPIDSERLMELSSGNALSISVGARMDGPVVNFGSVFWEAVTSDAPLVMAAIRKHGVASAIYTDRYLLTPLNMSLLASVLKATPGSPKISITTAQIDRRGDPGYLVFHPFTESKMREEVMRQLWPSADLRILVKPATPHARSLKLILKDGLEITILLDQGFGGWRSLGAPRHNFTDMASKQANAIRTASYNIAAEACDTPFILWQGDETLH
jgi:DEAD/DEAH box helicase domain-containing protein